MQELADAQGIDLNTPHMQEMLDNNYPTFDTQPVQPAPQVPKQEPAQVNVPPASNAMDAFTTWQNQGQMPTTGADIYGPPPVPIEQPDEQMPSV